MLNDVGALASAAVIVDCFLFQPTQKWNLFN
jgi:hypothetical protein